VLTQSQFILGVLGVTTYFRNIILTSPYRDLFPSLSSFPYQPFTYIKDFWYVFVMHTDYETQQTDKKRANNILDAQKRRLYRRAHGMEDLDRDEDQGVDVRGIAPWDDGLTKREREGKGIGANRIKMIQGIQVDEFSKAAFEAERIARESHDEENEMRKTEFLMKREGQLGLDPASDPAVAAEAERRAGPGQASGGVVSHQQQGDEQPPEQKKRKIFFGIW
jgi:hypothetical protein